jgi:hypothetical protein
MGDRWAALAIATPSLFGMLAEIVGRLRIFDRAFKRVLSEPSMIRDWSE